MTIKTTGALVAALALALCASAAAQTPKSAAKQPPGISMNAALAASSFMGFALDLPFPGDMKPCPKSDQMPYFLDREAMKGLTAPCFYQNTRSDPDTFEVWNGPDLGIGHTLEVLTFNGMPLSFRMVIGRVQFREVAEIFTAKYGPAHRRSSEPVRTRDGQKEFISHELDWTGARLNIRLTEIAKDVRRGEVLIENVQLTRVRDAERANASREAAGKL